MTMTVIWDFPVQNLREGDVITQFSSSDEVTVEAIESPTYLAGDPEPWISVHGRITRGFGRGARLHTWRYRPDQRVDIRRAG
jgi:hypothetical protein